MKYNEFTNYNEHLGLAACEVIYKGKSFVGTAKCAAEDEDFKSELTGCEIASCRAEIKCLKHIRDTEVLPKYETLKHLHSLMKDSKYYNKKSYEAKTVYRQLKQAEADLITIRQEIKMNQDFLRNYISGKDALYQKLRANRAKVSNPTESSVNN